MTIHSSLLAGALLQLAVGCAEPIPVERVSPLSPNREMHLAYRYEMHTDGTSVSEELLESLQESKLVRRTETPYTSVEWGEAKLKLLVSAIPDSASMRVKMTIQRFDTGNTCTVEGKAKHQGSSGFEAGGPTDTKGDEYERLRGAEFIAVVDRQGLLTSSNITGEYWTKRKKELAEAIRQGAAQTDAELALRWETPGIFAALEDALAYLPPASVQPGQTWEVRRAHVLPYHRYGFYMCTNGCSRSEENTKCSVKSVRRRGSHSIAAIALWGRRVPHDPEKGMPQRVKHFELKGELELDLNTHAVQSLRIESTPTWARPGEEPWKVKFVETISLR